VDLPKKAFVVCAVKRLFVEMANHLAKLKATVPKQTLDPFR
jgi:hypothetical protein